MESVLDKICWTLCPYKGWKKWHILLVVVTGTAKAFVDVNIAHAAVIVLSNADVKIK